MSYLPSLLALSFVIAASAAAQPSTSPDAAECRRAESVLVQEIDVAQGRGRMLQRRQLAEQLEAVQKRCGTLPPVQSREESLTRLRKEILELRKELDRAETDLRRLQQAR